MNGQTLLLRQVNPQFLRDDHLSSQAFFPFPKDAGQLSVYDGDQVTAEAAYLHFTQGLKLASIGVWAVTGGQSASLGIVSRPDPLPNSPAHAVIDFGQRNENQCRKLAKLLRNFAIERGRLHPMDDAV